MRASTVRFQQADSLLTRVKALVSGMTFALTLALALVGSASAPSLAAQNRDTEPIRLDPVNPHYFFFHGKTIALVSSGEHYGAVLNADFDYRRYLATLEAEGLNYTRLFGGSYIEVPGKSFGIQRNDLAPQPGKFIAPWMRSDVPGYAGGGNKFDLDKWNPEYFERLHSFLAEAAKRGIVVEITLFSSQYGEIQWALSVFNAANNVNQTTAIDWKKINTLENGNLLAVQERYTRKLVREASTFSNVIFEIQNEPWSDQPEFAGVVNPYLFPPSRNQFPNSIEVADKLSIAWQTQVKQWIASEESSLPLKHLIAQNYCDFGLPVRDLIPGVSIVNFHYAYPETASMNQGIGKAIAYDETGFLGQDDDSYRRQAWNFMLSGGGSFGALDYSFTTGHEDGTDTARNGPGGGSPAFRAQLGFLSAFLKALPLREMAPDPQIVKHAGGAYPRVLSNHKVYAIYLDGSGPVEVTLNLPTGEYSGEWLNTKTGERENILNFSHAGGDKAVQSPEFQNGIALRLERRP
jgi:hypothetical protein